MPKSSWALLPNIIATVVAQMFIKVCETWDLIVSYDIHQLLRWANFQFATSLIQIFPTLWLLISKLPHFVLFSPKYFRQNRCLAKSVETCPIRIEELSTNVVVCFPISVDALTSKPCHGCFWRLAKTARNYFSTTYSKLENHSEVFHWGAFHTVVTFLIFRSIDGLSNLIK